ncbi:MAG: trigger factor [Bacillota bacterium]|nr:trigger factor [Bacillota bacterium]
MKVVKEIKEHNEVILEITVDAAKFEDALEKSYRKNIKQISLPGFRKGKAPRKMVEKAYGESVFYEDAMDVVFEDTYAGAIEESEVEPVSRPEIDIKQIGSGKDFIYTAKIYVKPEVELGDFKGIEVEKVEYSVKDEDVDAEIHNMLERVAHFVDITDKPVENGNVAVIDFEGFLDGVPFEGGKGENHNLTIGAGEFIPGFEDQLIGKNIGDEVDVNVTFPEEYHSAELAGKAVVFKVKINGIKAKEYPAIDDEFAKDVSEFDTMEALKKATRDKLEGNAENRTEKEQGDKIIEAVTALATIDIPDIMVENQIDEYIEDMQYRIQMQMPGITFEQYLQYTGSTLEQFRSNMKDRALSDVKTRLVLEKISKDEKIDATDADVDAEIDKIAEQYKMETDKVRELLKENGIKNMKNDIIIRKTVEFLKGQVKVK